MAPVCPCHQAEKCPTELDRRITRSKNGPKFKHPEDFGDLPLKAENYLKEALAALHKGHYATARAIAQTCTDIIRHMEQGEAAKSRAFKKDQLR